MTTLSIEDLKACLEELNDAREPCAACSGTGLTTNMAGEPDKCRRCSGDTVARPEEATVETATIAALIEGYIAMAEAKPKVSVKPLEWCQSEDGTEWYSTDDPSNNGRGTYWIHPSKLNDGEFELRIVEQRDGSYLDTEAAKAAAQADYEARILSALNIGGTND